MQAKLCCNAGLIWADLGCCKSKKPAFSGFNILPACLRTQVAPNSVLRSCLQGPNSQDVQYLLVLLTSMAPTQDSSQKTTPMHVPDSLQWSSYTISSVNTAAGVDMTA